MRFERSENVQLLIRLSEEELAMIVEGVESIGNLQMISDMDSLVFQYYRELQNE
ncbi:hypothetical protein ACFSFY_13750 [Sporosarcina siberiensis]|uniref:Uncharacterized protein n=1 Tax=Sporosarcina siberiensis TaxID=1365606 RepID=A0ABW4SHQ0_9BACL